MRRIVCLLAGVLLVVPSLGSDAPKEYDGVTDDTGLEGSWQQVGAVKNRDTTMEMSSAYVWTYRNGKVTLHLDGILTAEDSYTVDASFRPARMDCVKTDGEFKGKRWRHIYRIEGGTLWIAYGKFGGERPRSFEDADGYVGIYKRVKK
jgi:uncharacterized protein (TIGR03067 family)